jgi:hypothetical protein
MQTSGVGVGNGEAVGSGVPTAQSDVTPWNIGKSNISLSDRGSGYITILETLYLNSSLFVMLSSLKNHKEFESITACFS